MMKPRKLTTSIDPPFDRVKAIFSPHDVAFNKSWLTDWTSSKTLFHIPEDQLTRSILNAFFRDY